LGWATSGEIAYAVVMQQGFENIPDTLNRLFTGKNFGKQLLKLGDPVEPWAGHELVATQSRNWGKS
jgi:hypothetical protein